MNRKRRPRYASIPTVANWYGVSRQTVWTWVKRGWLKAAWASVERHYSDERPHTAPRRLLRIHLDDLEAFDARFRGGLVGSPAKKRVQ